MGQFLFTDNTNYIEVDSNNAIKTKVSNAISLVSGQEIKITDGTDNLEINSDGSSNVFAKITDGTHLLNINSDGSLNITDELKDATYIEYTRTWTGAETNFDLWTPASGKKFVLCDILIGISADCTVRLLDEANKFLDMNFKLGGGLAHSYKKPKVSAIANNDLKLTTTSSGGSITVSGYEI